MSQNYFIDKLNDIRKHIVGEFPDADPWPRVWADMIDWENEHSNLLDFVSDSYREEFDNAYEQLELGNFAESIRVFEHLASAGSLHAIFELGNIYATARYNHLDPEKAQVHYRHAASAGHQIAMLCAARLEASQGRYEEAERMLKPGLDDGWPPAQFRVAQYRGLRGRKGRLFTDRTVYPLLLTAASAGHPAAQVLLEVYMGKGRFGILRMPVGLWRGYRRATRFVNQNYSRHDR